MSGPVNVWRRMLVCRVLAGKKYSKGMVQRVEGIIDIKEGGLDFVKLCVGACLKGEEYFFEVSILVRNLGGRDFGDAAGFFHKIGIFGVGNSFSKFLKKIGFLAC